MLRCVLLLSLFILISITPAAAKDKPDAKAALAQATLENARMLSSLHQAGTVAYRLQATFETYDYKGVPDGKGSLTEIYLREGLWQRVILNRDKHTTITSVEGKLRSVSDPDYQSTFPLGHVINDLFAPIPAPEDMKRYTFKTATMKMPGILLNCVIGSLPLLSDAPSKSREARDNTAPNQAYCMDKDPAILRVIQGHNDVSINFNRILKFGSVYVPGDITMTEKGKMRAHLHVDTLVSVPSLSEKDIIVPPADSENAKLITADKTTLSHLIKRVEPSFSDDAKSRRVQGDVVLHAITGKDGHIRELELVSAPDDSLVDSAMDAVRQWVYSPFLLNGAPTEKEFNVLVSYRFQ